MKFNIGNEVTVIARGEPRAWQKGIIVRVQDSTLPWGVEFNDGVSDWFQEKDLAHANTWEGIAKNDVVVDEEKNVQTVIERLGDIVWLSATRNQSHVDSPFTIQELQDVGFTLKSAAPSDEVIEIGGKKYRRDEVEERLSELNEVE